MKPFNSSYEETSPSAHFLLIYIILDCGIGARIRDTMKKKHSHPPDVQSKLRLAAIIFTVTALTSLLITFQEGLNDGWFSMRCATLIVLYALLLGLVFVRIKGRALICIAIVSLLLPLYAFEIFINVRESRTIETTKVGIFDKVKELRDRGKDVHPFLYPLGRLLIHYNVGEKKYFPLGGIGNVTTVLCKEAGPFLIYKSDRYGFNNPDEEWEKPAQIAALGDSFVHGSCVKPEEHFAAILRQSIPGVLNLGMAGSGPLLKLANIREHLKYEKPKYVFWHFLEGGELYNWLFPNKSEFEQELKDPILRNYLNDSFSQNLREVRAEINQKLISFSNQRYLARLNSRDHDETVETVKSDDKSIFVKIRDWISLNRTVETVKRSVERFRLISAPPPTSGEKSAAFNLSNWLTNMQDHGRNKGIDIDIENSAKEPPLEMYRKVLSTAKAEVAAWGGELVFVYLPWTPTFQSPYRGEILKTAEELGLNTIDLRPDFEKYHAQSELFAIWDGYSVGHYSPVGYKILADKILKFLDEKGALHNLTREK